MPLPATARLPLVACVLAVAAMTTTGACASNKDPEMNTVSHVDLTRYAGRWYEVTKIPNRFQKKCVSAATAVYALRDDGRISVTNRCTEKDGAVNEVTGVARIVDDETNAKLEVSFVRLFGWQLFWGDYWIIGLDEDYQWAIVGHPQRKFGWVLSRTPELNAPTMEKVFSVIEANGYHRAAFETMTP